MAIALVFLTISAVVWFFYKLGWAVVQLVAAFIEGIRQGQEENRNGKR